MSRDGAGLPLVSVVIPVYNAEEYVRESINSIVEQTYNNLEIIVVDDGSTDGTSDLLKQMSREHSRLRLMSGPNRGIVKALNSAIDASRGKYILRMDADDIALKDRVEQQVLFMEKNINVGAAGTLCQFFGASGKLPKRPITKYECYKAKFFINPIVHPASIIRAEVLKKYGIRYREDYQYAEDYKIFSEISNISAIANIKKVLLMYRVHGSQLTSIKQSQVERVHVVVARENFKNVGISVRSEDLHRFLFPRSVGVRIFMLSAARVMIAILMVPSHWGLLSSWFMLSAKNVLKTIEVWPYIEKMKRVSHVK